MFVIVPTRFRYLLLLNLIALLICISGIKAQEPFMYHYSVKDGLPSKEVHAIFQDSKDHIWICTDGGIARYNANNFKIFSSANGLPDNTVFEVMEDVKGRIWFRTFAGGIGYIIHDTIYSVPANKKIMEWQNKGLIQSFAMDEKGNIWLGRTGPDECFFIKLSPPYGEENMEKIPGVCGKSGVEVRHFGSRMVFAEGRLPSKLGKTLYVVIIRNENNKIVFRDTILSGRTSGFSRFFKNGSEIIFSSEQNIRTYDLKTGKSYFLKAPAAVITLLKDKQSLMIGYRLSGLSEYYRIFDSVKVHYLQGQSITAITKDKNNGYWFGTLENGIYYCPDKDHYRIKVCDKGEENVIVSSVQRNDSVILVGTLKGEVLSLTFMCNGEIKKSSLGFPNGGVPVQALYCLDEWRALAIFDNGNFFIVNLKDYKSNKMELASFKAIKFHSPNYYVVTIRDIRQYDSIEFKLVKKTEFNQRLTALAFDEKEDKIFIGGIKGLYQTNALTENFSKPPVLNSRVEDLVYHNGRLLIATKNSGVLIKTGTGYDSITVNNGLASNICRKLFVKDEDIWVLTSTGLSRIKQAFEKEYKIKNYNFADGIFPEGIFTVHFVRNAMIYCEKGDVYSFRVSDEEIRSPFRISSVSVNGIARDIKKLELKNYESDVQVNFEALFYNNNRSIEYRYRFESDTAWKYTRSDELRFPNLGSGSYSLLLQTKNNAGEWINCSDQLRFRIDKPVWQKWGFIFFGVIVVVSMVLLVARRRYIKILKKERAQNILNTKVHELEVKHLKSQMNPHFIFNSLNTLQRFILEEDTSNAHTYLTKFSGLLRKMMESSTSDAILLKDEIEIIKSYIETEKIRFGNSFHYEIAIHVKDPEKVKVPYMLVQPFVENAIWHGLMPKAGERILKIEFSDLDEQRIMCIVDDNGVGRNYKNKEINPLKKRSLAIDFISQRLDLLQKSTGIKSWLLFKDKKDGLQSSLGTSVEIILPKLNTLDFDKRPYI